MDLLSIQSYPQTVRFGLYSLVAAWGVFLWSVHQYYGPEFFNRFAIGGILIIFFMLRLKNWARMLCLCANMMAVIYCSLFGLIFAMGNPPHLPAAIFSGLCVLLFLLSSYFFLLKPSRDFYKAADPKGSGPFPDEVSPGDKSD